MTGTDRHPAPAPEQRYGVLLGVSRALATMVHPQDLFPAVYEQASRVLEATDFQISLYDAARDEAIVVFQAYRGDLEKGRVRYRGSAIRAIREARPVLESPTAGDGPDPLPPLSELEQPAARISAPMVRRGRVLGVVSVQSYRPDAYHARDLELLTAIADLLAVSLDNAEHLSEEVRSRREAERLEEIGRELVGSLELPNVLERFAGAALDLAEADSVSVWLLTGEGSAQIAMTAGESAPDQGISVPIPPALREKMVVRRESLVVPSVKDEPLLPPQLREKSKSASGIAVPLVGGDRVIGALAIGHLRPRKYRPEDVRLLERLGFQAGVAVENARLHQRIRNLSLTDPLTSLPNRRRLQLVLDQEFAAARRGRPLAVVLFDLDDFKSYNDAVGHHAGDEALRVFGKVLESETRAMNLVARYGGDEFVAVLSDATYRGGVRFARRIDRLISEHEFLARIGIRVSAGIAVYVPEMANPADLLRAADRDLYNRKQQRKRRETPAT